jgi:PAS domain S-box-containing protein
MTDLATNRSGGTVRQDIFFAAVQMSRMPMCLSDPAQPDNPIIFCNQAFEQLTGYGWDEVVGRNCRFLQGAETDQAAVALIGRTIREGGDVHQEILNYRKDGSTFWNALFISPVIDGDGKLIYFFASQLDVTRRRHAEAAMRQAQRMETLGGLASGIAHEFNNLMTIVLASLDRLGSEASDEKRQRYVDRAAWGARRAARLTDQMLSFARRQFHDKRTVDLNVAIAEVDGILDQAAGNGVSLRLELWPRPLVARVDPGQLELALLNLVRNAADATVRGGEIVVATRAREQLEGEVELTVADTGAGMTPEVASRAVEPFFTTKEQGSGTGLGLSMVSGFVEQSEGRLEIETSVGAGTTVRLIFPRVPQDGTEP